MRSHSWTYLYLKQRAGGKKSAGNIAFGLLTKLLILFTVFVYGIMLGALIESGFITQSCSLLLGILLLFILDMILEEDRRLLLPFLSREPRAKVVRRELILNIFSIANLYAVCLLFPSFLFVLSDDSNVLVSIFAILSIYSIGGVIWQLSALIKQMVAGKSVLRFSVVGIAGALILLLILLRYKLPDIELLAYLGTPVAAGALLTLLAFSSILSKKVIEEDLYRIYNDSNRKTGLVKSSGKSAFSSLPVARGYMLRCPGVRNQFFSLLLLIIINLMNFNSLKLPMVGVAMCIATASLLILPNTMSYMSSYMGGIFTRPDIIKKVLDSSYYISSAICLLCSIIGACFLHFYLEQSILPAVALFLVTIGPLSFLSLVSNIYPVKFDLWSKRQKNMSNGSTFLLGLAKVAILSAPAFLIPINEKYFSWAFIALGSIFLPFYPMVRNFVCSEIKERKYKIFEKMS